MASNVGAARPDAFARLDVFGAAGHRSGIFVVRFGATDRCDAAPEVFGVILTPVNTGNYSVVFDYSTDATRIAYDVSRRRIVLTGQSEAGMRGLLSRVSTDGGVRVNPAQRIQLQMTGNGQDDPNDDRYVYTFAGGQLESASGPTPCCASTRATRH